MKPHRQPLQPASLAFDEQGVPASTRYGDVYHARAGAIEQARHVFLQGNRLPERWSGREAFTVCETGFGIGNTFLALWQAWRGSLGQPRRLHVLSFEAHPFSAEDLAVALAGHTGELRKMANALVRAWPPLLPGMHRLEFEGGRLTLTLAFGQVEYLARQVEASVDAFFLDGFAPRLNPAMWSRQLFGQLVRISNAGATAASWCCAGQVRRDLAAAGFLVSREPGFGGKRQMLCATLRPGLGRAVSAPSRDPVIVVGGGLAGAGMAHSLALRGHAVTVLDPAFARGPAGGHEGHRCAAMTPALSRDDNPMSRLSRAGILLGRLRWQGLPGVHETCGSLVRMTAAEAAAWQAALEALGFPPHWARWCPANQTETHTGWPLSEGGVWLGAGALVRPARLVTALLAQDDITVRAQQVGQLIKVKGSWWALTSDGVVLAEAPRVVIAAAADAPALLRAAVPDADFPKLASIQRMGGQVAHFHGSKIKRSTRAIVAGAGYWLPQDNGVHVGGSTYVLEAGPDAGKASVAGSREVAEKVARLLEIGPQRMLSALAGPNDAWAGWRAALSDHLPVIGPVDARQSLWLACAYGSRGLSWMTLAGEIMAARLGTEPQPLERELLNAVRPR